jgi:phosphate:Na+ symporter
VLAVSAFTSTGSALALGLALLLFGMWLLREGLREVAGEGLQRWLTRVTASPLRGALAGAAATAAVQSSSATIVTAIGFASAGVLEFSQALGIVFGANVGTTLTGWLVLAFGIRWKLAFAAPLLALAGVWLHLYAKRRVASAGRVLAGLAFALLGIEALGGALGSGAIASALLAFPGDTLGSRLALVALGTGITLVTQSSSAGVAATLAAIHAGALTFPQAAAVVIGFDLGTTASAVIAALRGSLAARRTGFAHVIFNVFTAVGAFALLAALPALENALAPGALAREPEIALVAFHSFFNLAGVVVAIPLAREFAHLVERLVPERRRTLTRRLDARLLGEPQVALNAVAATLGEIAQQAFSRLVPMLAGRVGDAEDLEDLELALIETQQFVARAGPELRGARSAQGLLAALHAVDELHRLLGRMRQARRVRPLAEDAELAERAQAIASALPRTPEGRESAERGLERAAAALAAERSGHRERVIAAATRGELTPALALDRMDTWRWLERCAHHGWRIVHHIDRVGAAIREEREPAEPA